MSKPFPALCRDCKHSKPEADCSWSLRCTHPKVNARDSFALGGARTFGSDARAQRDVRWFAPCGMAGKLWEPKDGAMERT